MIQKDKIKKMKEKKLLIYLLIFLIVISISYAIPVPHGISGHIFELDGITTVGKGVDFSIYDTRIGEFIQGKTRENGYYTVSLNGNDGDIIIIRTWNEYHFSNRTVTLQGVMHNVDLLLNMSLPNYPPVIISEPVTYALVNKKYEYDVDAVDPDNDILEYKLLMELGNMRINEVTGLIMWNPKKNHVGNNTVIVEVSDGNLTDIQMFNVTVYSKETYQSYQQSLNTNGLQKDSEILDTVEELIEDQGEIIFEKPDSVVMKVILKGHLENNVKLSIKELSKKPDKIKSMETKVYKYLDIKSSDRVFDNAIIQFKVDKKWLSKNEAEISDVILNRYNGKNWERLSTKHIRSSADYEYFEAETSELSYFAISLKFIKEPFEVTITGPKEPHVISGVIFKDKNNQVGAGTEFTAINRDTGEVVKGKTGYKSNSGGYYILIDGNNGDIIDIKVKEHNKKITIALEGDMRNADIVLTGSSSLIIGNAIAVPKLLVKNSSSTINVMFATLMLAIALFVLYNGSRKD